MGHTEMRLAVAGLEGRIIEQRTRRLASGDWSAFTPAERAAFSFAYKQARQADAVWAPDFRRLVNHFGKERALDLVWWNSHCHYMTRVADAFQLPLERENVFDGFRSSSQAATGPGTFLPDTNFFGSMGDSRADRPDTSAE